MHAQSVWKRALFSVTSKEDWFNAILIARFLISSKAIPQLFIASAPWFCKYCWLYLWRSRESLCQGHPRIHLNRQHKKRFATDFCARKKKTPVAVWLWHFRDFFGGRQLETVNIFRGGVFPWGFAFGHPAAPRLERGWRQLGTPGFIKPVIGGLVKWVGSDPHLGSNSGLITVVLRDSYRLFLPEVHSCWGDRFSMHWVLTCIEQNGGQSCQRHPWAN